MALPALFVAAGLLVGLLLDRVLLKYLKRLADRTPWPGDEVIISALRGIPVFWGFAGGLYAAVVAAKAASTFVDALEMVLLVSVLWSLTILGARVSAGFTAAYAGRQGSFLPPTSIIPNLVRLLAYVVGLLVVLHELDISITPLLTALGVGGLAVALALQDTLTNVFAGLYLIAARQFKPGDYVRLESGEEGYIADITWRATSVRTILDTLVIVPNAKLASAIVTNYCLPERAVLVQVPVGVDYESDLEHVERVTVEAAREALREVTGRAPAEEPFVRLQAFGEAAVTLAVTMRVPEVSDQFALRHAFLKTLHRRYREEGIRVPVRRPADG